MDNLKHKSLKALEWVGSFFSNQPNHFSLGHQAEERNVLGSGELASLPKSPQIIYMIMNPTNEWWREVGKNSQGVTDDIPNGFILDSYSAQMPNHKILTSAYNVPYGHLISWVIFILTGPIINGIYDFLIIISEQDKERRKTKSFFSRKSSQKGAHNLNWMFCTQHEILSLEE